METNQAQAKPATVVNPLSSDISVQLDKQLVSMQPAKFSFRTTAKIDGDTGQVVKDEKGAEVKWKRDTFVVPVPLLTMSGLIAALQTGDKSAELALEQANDVILQRVRGMIAEKIEADPNVVLTPEMIETSKLNFLDIALLPRGERGAGISKEEFVAFAKDYIEVMQSDEAVAAFPDKQKRSLDVLNTHANLLTGKLNQVRSRKDVVEKLDTFLDIWATVSKNAEEHVSVYELLKAKAKVILEGDDLNNL